MKIGILREHGPTETRVAATPATTKGLLALGYDVIVDAGAGQAANFADEAYRAVGAAIGPASSADVVVGVNVPSAAQLSELRGGAVLVGCLGPARQPELLEALAARGITALAMDAVPRISRAQSLDVLSSMANIAGYRAVIEAAHRFGRFLAGQVTAAGKVPPAKVLVVGAGVAGLAAIGTAGSLGAVVRASDPRPEVADQVRSLGAEYVAVAGGDVEVSASGYAKEMSESYRVREQELYAAQCRESDIVVTTALIPGKPAPRLITAEMVASMAPGSVIVDLAAGNGGNVEGSRADEVVTTPNGVTIIGYTDLPGRLPAQASQLYGTNVLNLFKLLTPGKDGMLVLNFDDVVVRGLTVVRGHEVTWPPPPVAVSAAAIGAESPPAVPTADGGRRRSASAMPSWLRPLAVCLLFVLAALAPSALQAHLTVFALAVVVGCYVIGRVHHALHTPLMSVTNAISGIIVAGAVVQLTHPGATTAVLGALAVFVASINVFGGFAVTHRMLGMFVSTRAAGEHA